MLNVRSARLAPTSCVGRYSLIVVEATMRRRPGDVLMPGRRGERKEETRRLNDTSSSFFSCGASGIMDVKLHWALV